MPPIRVLVVDDSSVIRKVLCEALTSDSDIAVAGTAADGHIALAKLSQLHPDLVTLDVEMPNMSGLDTIREIRKLYPKLPIIMFSTLTERGASTTLDALALGASDYVTKPSNTGSLGVTLERIKQDLIPKIKALCKSKPAEEPSAIPSAKLPAPARIPTARPTAPVAILAIGTSTGGPNALAEVIPALPRDFPVPVVVVQHMPPLFTRLLADRLNKQSVIQVHEGEPGRELAPGQVWIAPGDYHMTVEREAGVAHLVMNQNPPENSCRPAVDPLFRSVAQVFGPSALAVVLTGMGSDGVVGSQFIRERGGQIVVQDEASSVVWGMPGQVAAAGLADGIFPLNSIAREVIRRVAARPAAASASLNPVRAAGSSETLQSDLKV